MKIRELLKWNNAVSAVYALGVWTMISTYGYLKYTGRLGDKPGEDICWSIRNETDDLSETLVLI